MRFVFRLATLDPFYLNFALGAGLKVFVYQAGNYWLYPDAIEDEFPQGILVGARKLMGAVNALGQLPLGDIGKAKSSLDSLYQAIEQCINHLRIHWSCENRTAVVQRLCDYQDRFQATTSLFQETDFPVSEVTRIISSRVHYQEFIAPQYSAAFQLGSLLAGLLYPCVLDDDYPDVVGTDLITTDFQTRITEYVERLRRFQPNLSVLNLDLIASSDEIGMLTRIKRAMMLVGKTLRSSAKKRDKNRPAHLSSLNLAKTRLAYELLLDVDIPQRVALENYKRICLQKKKAGISGFLAKLPERPNVNTIKSQAKQFQRLHPYLPSILVRVR